MYITHFAMYTFQECTSSDPWHDVQPSGSDHSDTVGYGPTTYKAGKGSHKLRNYFISFW